MKKKHFELAAVSKRKRHVASVNALATLLARSHDSGKESKSGVAPWVS